MATFEIDPNKEYFLIGDISASMQTEDPKTGGVQRYGFMLEKFSQFIKASEDFDPNGPTVILFGETVHTYENTNLEAVGSVIGAPVFEGFTNTHLALDQAFALHKALPEGNKSVAMIFTDGAPTNRKALEKSIRTIADSLTNDDDFSIIFLTVGTIDTGLEEFLAKLDDGLTDVKFDIVDVKALEEVDFLKAVEGAIND